MSCMDPLFDAYCLLLFVKNNCTITLSFLRKDPLGQNKSKISFFYMAPPGLGDNHVCWYSFRYGDVSPCDLILISKEHLNPAKRTNNSSGVPTTPTPMPKSV
jgi:hypothetical protein